MNKYPGSARWLSGSLNQIRASLRQNGIDVTRTRGESHDSGRLITIDARRYFKAALTLVGGGELHRESNSNGVVALDATKAGKCWTAERLLPLDPPLWRLQFTSIFLSTLSEADRAELRQYEITDTWVKVAQVLAFLRAVYNLE